MSQVHYFVIIINWKSWALSLSQECRNWILHLKVNFLDGITQISLCLFHPFASIHLSFILLHFDASLHLLWFTLFIRRHLFFFSRSTARLMFFPLCIVTLPLANLWMCVCVHVGGHACVCALVCLHVHIFFCPDLFNCEKLRLKKTTLKAITPLKSNAFGECNLTIRWLSYLFIFLSIHLYSKRGNWWNCACEVNLHTEQRHTYTPDNPTLPWVNLSFCLSTKLKTYSEEESYAGVDRFLVTTLFCMVFGIKSRCKHGANVHSLICKGQLML